MTSAQARQTRRAVLQAVIDCMARCTGVGSPAPDFFFRGDDEPIGEWRQHRDEAIAVCTACPARAACRELALRDGDGYVPATTRDDMVRGGLSNSELVAARREESASIRAAVAADRDSEWTRLVGLSRTLTVRAAQGADRIDGQRRPDAAQAAHNKEIRALAGQIHEIRTARRARTGWGEAA
ncbi:transcription factor WhiB [Streptomyces sp. SDr-06]|nr:transcription factor WhiB [Streptomyces sp. SDr-06]